MPKLSHRLPSYRRHKSTNRAVVTLNGRDVYLGRYGTPESKAEYQRVLGEWISRGKAAPPKPNGRARTEAAPDDPAVVEVIAAFMRHADRHYRDPDGKTTREIDNYRDALRPVRKLYGHTPAREFGPLALRAARDAMVKAGLARSTINDRVNRVRRVFKWAASVEMVPASVHQSLRTVDGLRIGRTEAREADPIGPVPVEIVEATLPHLPPAVAAMVRVQLLTGMRAGEVQIMRGCDLEADGPVWEYRPSRHKNLWRGRDRVIPIGPKAQAIIREFLTPDPSAFVFVGVQHRRRIASYQRNSYCQAVVRGCDRAFPHPTLARVRKGDLTPEQRAELAAWRKAHRWSPLQLRHAAATAIRARYGLEAAQVVLGHARADTTEIYAQKDLAQAVRVAKEIG